MREIKVRGQCTVLKPFYSLHNVCTLYCYMPVFATIIVYCLGENFLLQSVAHLCLYMTARVVSCGPVRHIQRQGQDVVCLVPRIVVSQGHGSLSVGSDRAPVVRSTDGPLRALV